MVETGADVPSDSGGGAACVAVSDPNVKGSGARAKVSFSSVAGVAGPGAARSLQRSRI
jgi:hypothetical protein